MVLIMVNEKKEDKPLIMLYLRLMKDMRWELNVEKQELEEKEKQNFKNSINLTKELSEWCNSEEIKTAKFILENLFENYSNIKNLSKSELLGAIDYSLSEMAKKTLTQQKIAKRHKISVYKLRKARLLIAPYIPINFFYNIFLSNEEINSNKEKTFIFKVNSNYFKNYWCKLELLESQTLDDLHDTIQRVMEFDNYFEDHLYSFFMSGKEWDCDTEYCGPAEYQEYNETKKTTITLKELNLGYKQKFLYLYDYGDQLKYIITVIGVGIYDKKKKYPYHIM